MTMRLTVALVIVAAGLVGGYLVAARLAAEAPAPAPSQTVRAEGPVSVAVPVKLKPRAGRQLALPEAVKELDLIRPARPKAADAFTAALSGGGSFRLADQRGKVVFVNFWATWCPPCREEMPAMERLWQQHRDQGFVMIAVSVDADPAKVRPFVDEHKLTFPVALDSRMEVADRWGVRALPSSFVVDRDGYLAALALGPRAWDNDAAHSLVEGLLR